MASKISEIIKQPRVWLLLLLLLLSLAALPSFDPEGVRVSFVRSTSPFYNQIQSGQIITAVNGVATPTLESYAREIQQLQPTEMLTFTVDGKQTVQRVLPNLTVTADSLTGVHVTSTARHNVPLGLDLQGGASVTLRVVPTQGVLTDELLDTTIQVLGARLNAFGLRNMVLRQIQDVQGGTFIRVEMAGEGSEQIVELVKGVGKFELRILNETIFEGDAILPPVGEPQQDSRSGSWQIPFTINTDSAHALRDAYVSKYPDSPVRCVEDTDCTAEGYGCALQQTQGGQCIPEIGMFLDNEETFAAPPSFTLYQSWLGGDSVNNLQVQTRTFDEAHQVQVVLEAGRLPARVKELVIESQEYIDPRLGRDFIRGAVYAAIAALFAVSLVIGVRYRNLRILLPILFVDIAEIIILLGLASLINWSIDLPAIAGIIVVLGTAVDQQIVITDEVLAGKKAHSVVKQMVKKAYKVVIIAASTTIAAMLPLAYPGFTGLFALRGFAIVTILGVFVGLLITRPAYAKMIEILMSD